MPTTAALEALLDRLCVKLGFCIAGEQYDRLVDDPATDPVAYAEAVMAADGCDPRTLPGDVYDQVVAEVKHVFGNECRVTGVGRIPPPAERC